MSSPPSQDIPPVDPPESLLAFPAESELEAANASFPWLRNLAKRLFVRQARHPRWFARLDIPQPAPRSVLPIWTDTGGADAEAMTPLEDTHEIDPRITEILDRLQRLDANFMSLSESARKIDMNVDAACLLFGELETRVAALESADAKPDRQTAHVEERLTGASSSLHAEEAHESAAPWLDILVSGRLVATVACAVTLTATLAGIAVVRPPESNQQISSGSNLRSSSSGARRTDIVLPADVPAPPQEPPETDAASTPPARPAIPGRGRSAGFIGTLSVESVPSGAVVMIDRRKVGVTPMSLPSLRAGSYALWIERDGYVRWTAAITVPAYKITHVSARLDRER